MARYGIADAGIVRASDIEQESCAVSDAKRDCEANRDLVQSKLFAKDSM